MNILTGLKKVFKVHGYHAIFGISILSLAVLVGWWTVFINQSIKRNRLLHLRSIESTLKYHALVLGVGAGGEPEIGIYKKDARFEVVNNNNPRVESFVQPVLPKWPGIHIQVRERVLQRIENEFTGRNYMLIAESGFLFLLILLSVVFLYKYVHLAKRSNLEIEEFWGRVTHEIKTPITGLKAFLQSLKNNSIDIKQIPVYLELALKQIGKQEKLAENIRLGSGLVYKHHGLDIPIMEFELTRFIKDYFSNHAISLTDAALELRYIPDKKRKIIVYANDQALNVILDNIVDNAIRYCSPRLKLSVDIIQNRKNVVILLTDNGPGFSQDRGERIFEAYKYPDSDLPVKSGGSGMGLNISRRLAKKLGGNLQAVSNGEGHGAQFKLTLKLCTVG